MESGVTTSHFASENTFSSEGTTLSRNLQKSLEKGESLLFNVEKLGTAHTSWITVANQQCILKNCLFFRS
jgi:hypothetical protein